MTPWSRPIAAVGAIVASLFIAPAAHGDMRVLFDTPEKISVAPYGFADATVVDFDGDHVPDLAGVVSGTLVVIRGLPDGWAPLRAIALPGSGHQRLAAAELTGDGIDDLVVAGGDGSVSLVRGRADGMPVPPPAADVHAVWSPVLGSGAAKGLALGDLDGDASVDVAVAFSPRPMLGGEIVTLTNDGHGQLAKAASRELAWPTALTLARLGGDADPDIVVAFDAPPDPINHAPGRVAVLPGAAGDTLHATATFPSAAGVPLEVAAGDFDGDGVDDVAVAHYVNLLMNPPAQILPGSPTGPTLGAPIPTGAVSDIEPALAAADMDRDGRDDLLAGGGTASVVTVLRSTGAFTFASAGSVFEFGRYSLPAFRPGDADGDGKLDLLAIRNGELRIYYGRGPEVRPDEGDVDFGTVAAGDTSAPRTLSFTNEGPGHASDVLVLPDGDAADFPITHDGCGGHTLSLLATCAVSVRFLPTRVGERELAVAVVAPDSDNALWTTLHGTGTSSAAPNPAGPVTPPGPRPATPAATLTRLAAARVLGTGSRLRLDTGWRVDCPRGIATCSARVTTVARATRGKAAPVLTAATVSVRAGTGRRLVVAVRRAGVRALRARRSVKAALAITVIRAGASPATATRSLTLRRPSGRQPVAASAAANAGFDHSGVLTTALPGQSATAQAVSVDAAGRITVAGSGFSNAHRRQTFTMVRYQPNGRLDTTFGHKGIVNQLRADRDANDYAENVSMIAQPDGKLVIAGLVGVPAADEGEDTGEVVDAIELRRYLPDGAPDLSFGDDGTRTVPFVGETVCGASPDALALGPAGTILVTGSQGCGGEGDEPKRLVVARLLADGSLDTAFGRGGLKRPPAPASGEGVAVASAGRILVAGSNLGTQVFATGRLTVTRLQRNGAPDRGFGRPQFPFLGFTLSTTAELALDAHGRIVVAGTGFDQRETRSAIGVVRLLANGRPDRTFHSTGTVTLAAGPGAPHSTTALALRRDGATVVTANRQTPTASRAVVARVSPNGNPDGAFGAGGQRPLAFGGRWDEANDVAVLRDGMIVVAGATGPDRWHTRIALARLAPP